MLRIENIVLILIMLNGAPVLPATDQIDKAVWIKDFKETFLAAWCHDDLIKECWAVPEKTCQEEVNKSMEECLSQMSSQIPSQFVQPKDGLIWGAKLGSCVGSQYAKASEKSFNKTSERCQDLDKIKQASPK